ncbi:uncharacterized protein LOC114349985 [Ostrinia furnacalis]|uniref:uncharacterized protein LOC114349985 n=1 Tax=Ostrinia furnacalis TaxID=93504 RepID=UPI00103B3973|nr:uncharacterized protein LOC114349985 [Ostrinia furnacalis]
MRRSLVPVLLLTTVALSSSNVLPLVSINKIDAEQLGLGSRQDDNIFSFRNHPRNILNDIFYTVSIATSQNGKQNKVQKLPQLQYVDNNQMNDEPIKSNKKDKYNGEGYRKEQWHNYPRQLDRLHKYLYEHHNADKRNPDPDDPNATEDYADGPVQENSNEVKANELQTISNDDLKNEYDAVVAVANPFLIFKIRLACLNSNLKDNNVNKYSEIAASDPEYIPGNRDEENYIENEINPQNSVTKVKREEMAPQITQVSESNMTKNRAVKKRIFSLWSRLQSFNHKGHELQHRRHLHAFYGLPDGGDTGGVLTAETRATFLRPPGSPLRWG